MADTLSNKILLKDREGHPLLPITNADAVQYNRTSGADEGRETVKTALDNINSYIGTVTNITSFIADKIGDLDSDTLVNIEADAQGNKVVPEGQFLSYIQIVDGKISRADYTGVTAANVSYNVSGGQTSDMQTVVTDLYKKIDQAAEDAAQAAQDAAKAMGVTQVTADAPIEVTSISESDSDAGKIKLSLNHDSTLAVTAGQLGVGTILKSNVSGLEDTLSTYWAEISKLESSDRATVGSVRQISYDYADSKALAEQQAREADDANIISYMGLLNNASYWTASNTIKDTTDALQARIESTALNVDGATILSNNNTISTGLRISVLKDTTVGDVQYKHAIALDDNNGTHLSVIDAADFVKDGMISDVTLSGNDLTFTWNTDSAATGEQPKTTTISLSAFVQDYAAGAGLEKSGTNPSYTVKVKTGNGIGATEADGTYIMLSSEGDTSSYLSFDASHALKLDGITTALSNAISAAVSSIGITSDYAANDNKVVTNATISNGTITLQRDQLTADQVSYAGVHAGTTTPTTVSGEIAYIHDTLSTVAGSVSTTVTSAIQNVSGTVDAADASIPKVTAKSHVLTKVVQTQSALTVTSSEATEAKDLVLTGITYNDTVQESNKTIAQVSSYLISQNESLHTTVDQLANTIVSSKGFTYVAVGATDNVAYTNGAALGVEQSINTEFSYTTYTLSLHDVASNSALTALNTELSNGIAANNTEGAVFYQKLYNGGGTAKTSTIDESIF